MPAIVLFAILLQSTGSSSGTGPPSTANRASAMRATSPVVIDGRDDDAVWRLAPAITQFREFQPKEDGDPRYATEAKEHTSELQSRRDLVCRLLLEKKKKKKINKYLKK